MVETMPLSAPSVKITEPIIAAPILTQQKLGLAVWGGKLMKMMKAEPILV